MTVDRLTPIAAGASARSARFTYTRAMGGALRPQREGAPHQRLHPSEIGKPEAVYVKSSNWDDSVLTQLRSSISDLSTREAFDALVAKAISIPAILSEPVRLGRDGRRVIYTDPVTGNRLLNVIANANSGLLFYVELAGRCGCHEIVY
jgi:hypothetical protein